MPPSTMVIDGTRVKIYAWYRVPAAVLLGIPLHANATEVIPVAEAMLDKGGCGTS